MRGFWALTTCRRYSGGPIAWDVAVDYGFRQGWPADMIAAFATVIRRLDDAFLEWWAEENERLAKLRKPTAPAGTKVRHRR